MDLQTLFARAAEHYRQHQLEEALQLVNEILALDLHQQALLMRAKIYCRMDRLSDGLLDFNTLVSRFPDIAEMYAERAVALHINNENDAALADFTKALDLEPNNGYRYASLAFFKDRIGDVEGAIRDYEHAIALDPDDAVSLNNLGLLQEKLGRIQEAKQNFAKADGMAGGNKNDTEMPAIKKSTVDKKKPKLTGNHLLNTIKDLLRKPESRKDFVRFLKEKLF